MTGHFLKLGPLCPWLLTDLKHACLTKLCSVYLPCCIQSTVLFITVVRALIHIVCSAPPVSSVTLLLAVPYINMLHVGRSTTAAVIEQS